VDSVLASIPEDASALDRDQIKQALNRLAERQSVRSAYKSKIKQLFGDDKADKFDALYGLRSNFLHDGRGRDSLGDAADATLEIGLQLLLADIAHSAAPSEANQVNSQGTSPMPDRIISRKADGCVFEVASVLIGTNPFAYGAKIAEMDRRLGRPVATYEVLWPFREIFVSATSVGRWQQLEEEHSRP
jgi:hypothetical protein